MMKAKFLIPLILFGVLLAFLAVGLNRDPREVPSPLVNKPAPAFDVPQLAQPEKHFSPAEMKGKVWVLNVWSSWCVSCREEHPLLVEFARAQVAPLIGLDYKDQRDDALALLKQRGNPYDLSAFDGDGRVGIDYGVYGVPETYIIDKNGVIRHKHIGPITSEALEKTIIPLIDELKKS
jgi:cytochrome c biogenesis protein CcmG/thiol:disulfide interchange protein DsbE